MDRKLFVAAVAMGLCAAAVFACVGDDPDPSNTSAVDGGDGTDGNPVTDTSTGNDGSGGDGGPAIPIIDVSGGDGFGCAVRANGSAVCWGRNAFGEAGQPLGGGEQCDGVPCRLPTVVAGVSGATKIASGPHQSCVVTNAGKVLCWGANDDGVLGHPPGQDPDCGGGRRCTETPSEVPNVTGAVGVAVGRSTACAWSAAGAVSCWGQNRVGGLARGTNTDQIFAPDPSPSFASNGATLIAADSYGTGHFCAVRADGTVSCWGRNSASELGSLGTSSPQCSHSIGTETCESTPRTVTNDAGVTLKPAASIATTDGATCVSVGAEVHCWGYVGHGVAGAPNDPQGPSRLPYLFAPASGLSALSGSFTHACGLTVNRDVKCWGENTFAEIGVTPSAATESCENRPCSSNPRTVSGVQAKRVFAGPGVSFAITLDDKVVAWGANRRGQLGHLPRTGENTCAQPCNPTPEAVVMP